MIRGVESNAVKRHEAYPAEDVEMDLTSADVPDDEFLEEPHVEEVRLPTEITNAVQLAIMRIHKNLGPPSKELLCRALRLVERTRSRFERREQNLVKSFAFEAGTHMHRIQSWCKSGSLCTRGLKRTSI